MQQIYKILGSLVIFILFVTALIISTGLILVVVGVFALLGIYRYYLKGKSSRKFATRSYFHGEVIDVKAEVLDEKTQIQEQGNWN